tara:strand:+ start:4347 stop:5357 length:1011 start_codon:yes stop_codon:yes gene_type:complete
MSEMKLIMESWRGFQEEELQTDILFEGTEKQVSFEELIVEYNNNIITEQQISQLWIESFDYEANLLIQEVGLLDALGKAKDKVADAYNSFVTKQFLRIKEFLSGSWAKIKQAIGPVIAVLGKIIGWVGKFCSKAPAICKLTLGLAVVFAVTMIMAVFADDAEASIKIGKTIYKSDSNTLNGVKGLCEVIHESSIDNETKNQAKNCISLINRHMSTDQVMDVADQLDRGGELIKRAQATLTSIAEIGAEQDSVEISQTVSDLIDLGEKQTLEITTKVNKTVTTIKSEFGSSTRTSVRKTVSKVGDMVPMKGNVKYSGIARDVADIARQGYEKGRTRE